jgi:GSH-dependent disulfide-bond oxidoreductase
MIELYYGPTANGQRAAVILEESGLPFRRHPVDLAKGEHLAPEFLALNPVGMTPAIVDGEGPGGKRIVIAQSVAIMLYVAEKAGRFIPGDAYRRAQMQSWLMFVASDIAMTSGTLFQLTLVGPEPSPAHIEHFEMRLGRFFAACDRQLQGREYLVDELSIADFALYPNVAARKAVIDRYGPMPNLVAWSARMGARPGVARGMQP